MYRKDLIAFCVGLFVVPMLTFGTSFVFAQTELEQLQSQISERNNRLNAIQEEIAKYESALKEVGAEKNTLQKAINQLELERKKIEADIRFTENKIESTDLTIDKISFEIGETEGSIRNNEDTIRYILRQMNIANDESLIEVLLRHNNIAEFWDAFESLETVRVRMGDKVDELSGLKAALENNRELNAEQREQLLSLKSQYSDQKNILSNNKAEKSELLTATKSEEASYQKMLKEKESSRDQLLAEVRDIESKIKFILDPNTIPSKGSGVLMWPLANPIITQRFGYTAFALSGAYGGSQHNGMDLGTPVGTQIHAPLSGRVRNVGNTDLVPGCYSWGKWILIDHPNGLSSMFAHLSQAAVTPGQEVKTGDVVGYSGSTGYSTGPHLHYTLYVTAGVQVMAFNQFKSVTGCGAALSPFAGIDAYLDPLDYLPPL